MLSVMDDARMEALDGHAAWPETFNEMFAQVAGVFGNASVRRRGRGHLLGLLSHAERKNSWWLAELAGEVSSDGMQRHSVRRLGLRASGLFLRYPTAMVSRAAMVSRESRRAFSMAATTQRSSRHTTT